MADALSSAVAAGGGQPSIIRVGVVAAVNPLRVKVQETGLTTQAGVLSSYTPVVGDVVALACQSAVAKSGATWLCLGRINRGSATPSFQAGQVSLSFGPATSFTTPVVFATPFAARPSVATNINSGAGSTAGWGSRAISVTASGFTLFVFGASNTWVNEPVQWQAVRQTQ